MRADSCEPSKAETALAGVVWLGTAGFGVLRTVAEGKGNGVVLVEVLEVKMPGTPCSDKPLTRGGRGGG